MAGYYQLEYTGEEVNKLLDIITGTDAALPATISLDGDVCTMTMENGVSMTITFGYDDAGAINKLTFGDGRVINLFGFTE